MALDDPAVRARRDEIAADLAAADFQVVLTRGGKAGDEGATIEFTVPLKKKVPYGVALTMKALGFPEQQPSSFTRLTRGRVRLFYEYGKPPHRGEDTGRLEMHT